MAAGPDAGIWARRAGFAAALLFAVAGPGFKLHLFGDGALFAYSVAADDAWAFHWHNISGRVTGYFYAYVPAALFLNATGSVAGAVWIYAALYFAAPLFGLLGTLAADEAPGRPVLTAACVAVACLEPFVFGFPTEMWFAHALFWPALAVCWHDRHTLLKFLLLAAMALTHEGATVFVATIVLLVAVRGWRGRAFLETLAAAAAAIGVWFAVKAAYPPDAYIAHVLGDAAYKFIDLRNLAEPAPISLAVASIAALALRRVWPAFAGLAIYWLFFDRGLLAEARYMLRTVLLIFVPLLAGFAVAAAIERPAPPLAIFVRLARSIRGAIDARTSTGMLMLCLTVHAVETAKFVRGWTVYRAAVLELAMDARGGGDFASSAGIDAAANRLAWSSTTPYLSVLLAPGFAPRRLVVEPSPAYFWLSCETATRNAARELMLPAASREMIRAYSCRYR